MTISKLIPLLCATIAISLIGADDGLAGQYTIHNCAASLEPNFDAGPWSAYGSAPPPRSDTFQNSCTPGSTLGTAIGWYGNEQTTNTALGITLRSPTPAITVRELRLVWSVAHQASGSDTSAQVYANTGLQLVAPTPYAVGTSNPAQITFPPGTQDVEVYSYCSFDTSSGCVFPSLLAPIIRAEGMDTTLEDTSVPTAVITGGTLAGDGPISGSASLQFTATDSGSGVREAQLLLDGSVIATHSYASQCVYTNFTPCPSSQADTMTIDTQALTNGQHQLALRVISTAGNVQTVDSHALLVSNEGPSVPMPPCAAASGGIQTTITVNARHHVVVSNYGEHAILSGRLRGVAGKPIVGASVEVLTERVDEHGSFSPLKDVTTRSNGRFTAKLPVGVSQLICLRYRLMPGGRYAAAVIVAQQVRAALDLSIYPPTVEPNGTIFLGGHVLGGFIPAIGKVVELQVHYLGSWRVFRTPRTDPRGHFESFYSFLGGQGRFEFRACVRAESEYPYIFGCSRSVSIRAG
jgi:hypothetical protein